MDLKDFKKLEKKVKKPEFGNDYKSLNILLKVLSILGNFASIFLASFFVSGLLAIAVESEIVVWIITLIGLSGLELTKRELFYRFSRDFIRTKTIFTMAVFPMLFSTMCLISLSFYSSLSGAQKFASQSDLIEIVAEEEIDTFSDSTNAYYLNKIEILETQNNEMFESNKRTDQQVQDLLDEHPTWTNSAKRLGEPKEKNNIQIERNDVKIKELKSERDKAIKEYTKDIKKDASEDTEKNTSDAYIFIAISTLIEFLILIGIYFANIYNFRTYRDFKRKMMSDKNFKQWSEYSEIIELLYLNREEKDVTPDNDLILELLIFNRVYLTEQQLNSALKLFDALKIIETNGDHRYLLKAKEDSEEALKKHFNIT